MTKKLKILGGKNCRKCNTLKENIERIVDKNNFNISVEKINDIGAIMEYDVMSLPALVLDEKVISAGKIPSEKEIIKLIND